MNLELQGITKRFGSLVANDHIDLSIVPGTIHALLGENGAGKTTLMNILYGLTQPDEGTILAGGKPLTIHSPRDAIAAGIGMVHQHFMLVPVFTVAENVTLGDEETRPLGLLDRRRMRQKVRDLSERYGLRVEPDALTGDLPVGVQQRVEILKALVRDARVLILDEPTAVLTPGETEDLFRIMRELRESGRAIVFISHKLKEVQAIAGTITVLRRGRVVGERPPSTSEEELAALMVGRSVQLQVTKTIAKPGRVMLDVRDLVVPGGHEGPEGTAHTAAVNGLSFQVRAGEILGVAGVQGNGQTELCEALMGLLPVTSGSVHLNDHDITSASPASRLRAGVGYIPEDRQQDGLVAPFPVSENLILDTYNRPPFASGPALDLGAIRTTAEQRVKEFDIRTQFDLGAGRDAVRRQPAEGHSRPRGGPRRPAAAGQPADPRPGRRVDRVRAPAPHRGTRQGRGRDARLFRAGRDLRPLRPDRDHVRGQVHRIPAARRAGRRTRPADGRHRRDRYARARGGGFSRTGGAGSLPAGGAGSLPAGGAGFARR